ncbi:MAG: hypothetical protein VX871_04010 [Pseudomonadota bacterium]|nr:hypothetical protein [Pseudomonadota bacterium]
MTGRVKSGSASSRSGRTSARDAERGSSLLRWSMWRGPLLVLAASLLVWFGGMFLVFENARLGDEASGKMLAVFGPGATPEAGFSAIARAGGEPVRPLLGGFAWVAHSREAGFAGRLKQNGAVAAYGEITLSAGAMLAGCAAWVRHRSPPLRVTP